ncbi:hypothetical protein Hdeb2414_s0009g00312001 [Helianthus debilis subsp. tardiflorus]
MIDVNRCAYVVNVMLQTLCLRLRVDCLTLSTPWLLSDDDDDFHPFVLPDFGDDVPHADGIPDEDPFLIHIHVQGHLILGHPDGEHVGDGVVADDAIGVPHVEIPIIEAVGLRRYAIDTDDDTAMPAAPIPPHDVEPGLELDFILID